MVAIKLIASVTFAAVLLAIFASLYASYQSGTAIEAFERDAEVLAQRIRLMADQDVGTQDIFEISVPPGCELRFEDNAVVAVINQVPENFDAGIAVSGPSFSNQRAQLTLKRVKNGVEIYG